MFFSALGRSPNPLLWLGPLCGGEYHVPMCWWCVPQCTNTGYTYTYMSRAWCKTIVTTLFRITSYNSFAPSPQIVLHPQCVSLSGTWVWWGQHVPSWSVSYLCVGSTYPAQEYSFYKLHMVYIYSYNLLCTALMVFDTTLTCVYSVKMLLNQSSIQSIKQSVNRSINLYEVKTSHYV